MWMVLVLLSSAAGFPREPALARDYFVYKDTKHVAYFTCKSSADYKAVTKSLISEGLRVAVGRVDQGPGAMRLLSQPAVAMGALLDAGNNCSRAVLTEASDQMLFDAAHAWLILRDGCDDGFIEEQFGDLHLSVDADIVVASYCAGAYRLTDVFNFGRIQGGRLESAALGAYTPESGLAVSLNGFKYYNRWDFHNLTLRAVSVIKGSPQVFDEAVLSEPGYSAGVAAMTKISSQLLNLIKDMHNFRFNYTIVGRWIGTPERNSTLTVSNSLLWREQDISSTCARLFPAWLEWVDYFFPPVTQLQTKFYYIIPLEGVGKYENQFLTPMSPGVWWCSAAAGLVCAGVLVAAAATEGRPEPGSYGVFSVLAAGFQQEYEDGAQSENEVSSQSRKMALLVVGLTSMLLYNYYTSSVVSWLLSAAAPTLATLDGLIRSDFELIFEDIGYTRGWLDNPGFFYYSGFKNPKEDELRSKKVTTSKRTVPLMQSVEDGIAMVRTGKYAYHAEPYTASQAISRTYVDSELCALGALQMIKPSPVYIMGQKKSPYKQFFVWSLMRLQERGHLKKIQARVGGELPACSGSTPRALSLGQAAPAFLLLAEAAMLAGLILAGEVLHHRYQHRHRAATKKPQTQRSEIKKNIISTVTEKYGSEMQT